VRPHAWVHAHTLWLHLSEQTAGYLNRHHSLFTNETVTHILWRMRYDDATCDRNHRWTEGRHAFMPLRAMELPAAATVVRQSTSKLVLSVEALIGV